MRRGLCIIAAVFIASPVVFGQKPNCLVRLESPSFPPEAWGSETQDTADVLVKVQLSGKLVVDPGDDSDEFARETTRVVEHSTFADSCAGTSLHLRFQFVLEGERSMQRLTASSFGTAGTIVVTAAPPANLCERKINTADDAAEVYGQGKSLSLGKRYAEAIRCFDSKLAFEPTWDAYIERGIARRKSQQLSAAIEDYDQAILLRPDNATAFFDRGNVYKQMGRLQDAVRDYSESIRLNPASANAYGNRGLCYLTLQMHSLAILDFEKAISLRPRDRQAWLNRGVTYSDMGQEEKAIADFDRAISLSPGHADAWNNRGWSYYSLGRFDRALQDYDNAIQLDSDYLEAWMGRGLTDFALHRDDEAEKDFSNAIRLAPDSPEAWEDRGRVRLRKGDKPGAAEDLARAEALRRESRQ